MMEIIVIRESNIRSNHIDVQNCIEGYLVNSEIVMIGLDVSDLTSIILPLLCASS